MRRLVYTLAIVAAGTGAAQAQPGLAKTPPGFAFPVDFNTYRITAGFDLARGAGPIADWTGWTTGDPTAGSGHSYDDHSGSDIGVGTGTNIYAIANGSVTALYEDFPTDDHSGGGNYMFFSYTSSGESYRVNNYHLNYQGALKSVGNAVTKGELVGLSDNTGNSTGPHLHFGISRSSATNAYSCPFYHGWWEGYEFYSADGRPCLTYIQVDPGGGTLNCRLGNSTAYGIITTLPTASYYVSSQRNGWWRVFLPMPASKAQESRSAAGTLTPNYGETGTWADDGAKSAVYEPAGSANRVTLTGAGSRYSEFTGTGGPETAIYAFTTPQRGNYKIMAAWPGAANAAGVTYHLTYMGGSADVVVDQRGASGLPSGTGTHADPYLIETNYYVANHTTIGGDDIWNTYTPAGNGIPENGPERVYKFTVTKNQTISVAVANAGYPGLDVDVHLLSSLSNTNCLARNDFSFTYAVTPGTYYIVADSYGNDNSHATNYTLTVNLGDTEPFANTWVSLGQFPFDLNGSYSVTVMENTVTGVINGSAPGRVYSDAIKIVPVITNRSGWISDGAGLSARVNTTTTPVCSVVVTNDTTAGNDSDDVSEYAEFPVYALPGVDLVNNSAIVAKVVTGQRFVCRQRTADGWYKIDLTSSTGTAQGWISGVPLYIYNPAAAPIPQTPSPSPSPSPVPSLSPTASATISLTPSPTVSPTPGPSIIPEQGFVTY